MSILSASNTAFGAINSGRGYVDTLANKYILNGAGGIGGFVFDYEGETTITLESEITDHWIETNTAIQDHVAIKPMHFTLRGFVGELVQKNNSGILGLLGSIGNKLSQVPAYLGTNTPGMVNKLQKARQQLTANINKIDNGLKRITNIARAFGLASPTNSAQKAAFAKLWAMWSSRQIVSVTAPFTVCKSMIIERITFIQDENTKTMSDISVTVKEIKQATTAKANFNNKLMARLAQQGQVVTSVGKTLGTAKPVSAMLGIFNAFR